MSPFQATNGNSGAMDMQCDTIRTMRDPTSGDNHRGRESSGGGEGFDGGSDLGLSSGLDLGLDSDQGRLGVVPENGVLVWAR